ncbi:Fe-S-containing protein [Paenibacillus wynnii]|uniref:Fe-S-containing protein n=1 Tax=Paenibacillus wynnii TaxID=268407 RepID=UPI002790A87C|nr:Fe-S-containing protein [Paenibacillus wynnii]MDQ0195410.1 putative membrane protein [Paenibacillus wynnii]
MLKATAITLGNGFEISLIISVLIVWLRHIGNGHFFRWIFAGTGTAAVIGWVVLYILKWSGPKKESFTGWTMALCFILEILFLIWLRKERKLYTGQINGARFLWGRGRAGKIFIFLTAAFMTMLPLIRILQFPSSIFIQTYSVVNTELILKFTGGLLGLVFSFLFGMSFLRSTRTLSARSSVAGSVLLLGAMMLNQIFTVAQILFARGVFPLTPLTMKILIPIINNMDKYLYVLLGASFIWTVTVLLSFRRRKEKLSGEWNPAVQRKFKARVRNDKRWLASIAGLMVLVPSLLGVEAVLASQTVELSPAEPVTPDASQQIVIPHTSVDDRNLHRFGYTAADGTIVRFIIIRKSETMYGIGFDACKICGSSGYYQKNNKVICRKCDVIMNISTIGFEGGCNPIPLAYHMDKGNLVIASSDLEKETATFHQEDLFQH